MVKYFKVLSMSSSGQTEEDNEQPDSGETLTRLRFEPGPSR